MELFSSTSVTVGTEPPEYTVKPQDHSQEGFSQQQMKYGSPQQGYGSPQPQQPQVVSNTTVVQAAPAQPSVVVGKLYT